MALDRPPAAAAGEDPQAARERAEGLLGEWADSWGRPGDAAGRALETARTIGGALAGASGDRLVHDAVAVIDAAKDRRDSLRLSSLVAGHRAYKRGLFLYRRGAQEGAAEELAAAGEALARADSPFAARAVFYRTACSYRLGSLRQSAVALGSLQRKLVKAPYGALLGHVLWMRGLIHSDQGDPRAAAREYERALPCFQRLGETGNVAAVHGLLSTALQQIGRQRDAWSYRYRALRDAAAQQDPVRRYILYSNAAILALADGELEAALRFQDEAVLQAKEATTPEALVEAYHWRGLLRSRAGLRQGAWHDLGLARQGAERLSDRAARRRAMADISMIEGEMMLAGDARKAVSLLTSSLRFYEEIGHNFLTLWVYRFRARAFLQAGDLERAEEDLQAALSAYERLGAQLSSEDQRLAYLNRTEEAFDEMIAFQAFERRRPEAAFLFADTARTRSLPALAARTQAKGIGSADRTRLLAAEPQPLDLGAIRRELPLRHHPGTVRRPARAAAHVAGPAQGRPLCRPAGLQRRPPTAGRCAAVPPPHRQRSLGEGLFGPVRAARPPLAGRSGARGDARLHSGRICLPP